ncbi:MAG: hypothetical protein MJY62_02630 [Bacteroidales bacterium]|nr:hypothetical protein [Bacteroidales bacterium]
MILIVECGATKSDWRVTGDGGSVESRALTGGINISNMSARDVADIVSGAALSLPAGKVEEIHFYCAGVMTDQWRQILADSLKNNFPSVVAEIEFQSDLVAAARAVCGHRPGIAAILGTGSNSCHWDGSGIVGHVNTGGFILGDEGGAARLGKIFISDMIKDMVPPELAEEFARDHDCSYTAIVTSVYGRGPVSAPNYLGSFAPFLISHYDHPYIKEMVDTNFRDFFIRQIKRYPALPLGIVGTFGWVCRDIISGIAAREGLEVSCFMKEPADGLVRYHSEGSLIAKNQ